MPLYTQDIKRSLLLFFLCDLCVPCGYYSFLLAMSVQPPDIQKGKGRLVLSFLCDLCVLCGYYSFFFAIIVPSPDIFLAKFSLSHSFLTVSFDPYCQYQVS